MTDSPTLQTRLLAKKSIHLDPQDQVHITQQRERYQESCRSLTTQIKELLIKNQQLGLRIQALMNTNMSRRLRLQNLLYKTN